MDSKGFIKELIVVQLLRKIAMIAHFHYHVKVFRSLEGVHEFEDVWVVHLLHDLRFSNSISDLVVLDEGRLLHGLHCIDCITCLLLHSEHFTEGTFANHLEDFEVREMH